MLYMCASIAGVSSGAGWQLCMPSVVGSCAISCEGPGFPTRGPGACKLRAVLLNCVKAVVKSEDGGLQHITLKHLVPGKDGVLGLSTR